MCLYGRQALQSVGNLGLQLGHGKEQWMAPLHPIILRSVASVKDFLDKLIDIDHDIGKADNNAQSTKLVIKSHVQRLCFSANQPLANHQRDRSQLISGLSETILLLCGEIFITSWKSRKQMTLLLSWRRAGVRSCMRLYTPHWLPNISWLLSYCHMSVRLL